MIYIIAILLIVTILFAIPIIFLIAQSIYINLKMKVPWVKTPQKNLETILNYIKLPKNALIYDLGCGDGKFLFLAEKYGYSAVGFELSFYPYLKCILKKYFSKSNIKIKRKNFYNIDFKEPNVIFLFLVKDVMPKIEKKLKNSLKKDTLVISYCFPIPNWHAKKIINTEPSKTYIYQIQ